jgi:dipeptidyl aminopeptidase/acylaminoacyl peptidase
MIMSFSTRLIAVSRVAAIAAGVASLSIATQAAPERGIHRYQQIAMSPRANYVASVEGDSSPHGGEPVIRELMIRSVDGKSAAKVALPCGEVRECWPSSPAWSPDGKTLVFALRKPGTHARSLYSVSPDGTGLKEILSFNGTIIDVKFSPAGKLAMLAVEGATKEVGATQAGAAITGDLSGPVPEQRIAILDGNSVHWASPAGMFVYQYDWLPDGSGFVGTAAPGDGDNNWWVAKLYKFGVGDGAANLIYSSPDLQHQIADPIVSRDGATIAFISGIMSDFGSTGGDVYSLPVNGGSATDITPNMHASARGIAWGCDNHLRVELLAGGDTILAELGDGKGVFKPATQFSGQITLHGDDAGVSLGCPAPVVATVAESFTDPPEIKVGTPGDWHDLTHENAGQTMPLTARSITWQSDGHDVQGWLLLPLHNKGKIPMIMIVHGGPAAASGPGFSGPGLGRKLLEKGYALFEPNPRGSFGQGEAFTAGNVRDFGYGDLRDDLAGIDAVERAAPIDNNRLGIEGGSYGGFMTMWTVTQTNRFKAGVAGAGIADWLSYYGENGIDEWMLPYFGGTVYDDPQAYARSSPINFIKNVKTPVFEYVGAQDIECPAPQTQEFWHALHDLGVPTSYAIYPGEGHGLRDPAHIEDQQTRAIAWFDKYLK